MFSSEPSREQNQISGIGMRPMCCTCIPVRLGVFLIAAFSVLTSVVMLFAKAFGVDTSVAFGGYVLESKVMIAFLEVSGAIWGFIGVTGAWQCHSNSVSVFFYFQVARLVVWVGVFLFDLPALFACEAWVTNLASQTEWNPRMYEIAMEGKCFEKRLYFYLVNVPLFLLFAYFTHVTYEFIEMLNGGLPYSMSEKRCHRAYVSASLAEKQPLNGPYDPKAAEPFPQPYAPTSSPVGPVLAGFPGPVGPAQPLPGPAPFAPLPPGSAPS